MAAAHVQSSEPELENSTLVTCVGLSLMPSRYLRVGRFPRFVHMCQWPRRDCSPFGTGANGVRAEGASLLEVLHERLSALPEHARATVQVIFFTDGHENRSGEYTAATVRALIEQRRESGWDFVFLGADEDDCPQQCASDLAYDGRLSAHPSDRSMSGVDPGLIPVPVEHVGRTTSSPEEADAVERIIRDLVGRPWHDGTTERPLTAADMIVVAPLQRAGRSAGRPAARRRPRRRAGRHRRPLPGAEAAVVIVSLSASSAAEVPRGVDFLLSINRLNVAISRGQWLAYLVHSPALRAHLPPTPHGVARLSAFLRLLH